MTITASIVRSTFDSLVDLTPGGHARALERARAHLLKDPTKAELRRIASATGVTTSCSDSAEDLRAKIQATAPEGLAQSLQAGMVGTTPLVELPAPRSPQFIQQLPPVATSPSGAAVLARSASLESYTLDRRPLTTPADVEASYSRDWGNGPVGSSLGFASTLPSMDMLASAMRPTTTGHVASPPTRRQHRLADPPMTPPKTQPPVTRRVHGSDLRVTLPSELSTSSTRAQRLEQTAAEVLADNVWRASSHGITPTPPSHSVILSKVIAAAERLELELAHTILAEASRDQAGDERSSSRSDGELAVGSARLEALRSHVLSLRTVAHQCASMQMLAEAKAIGMENENATLTCAAFKSKPWMPSSLFSLPLPF